MLLIEIIDPQFKKVNSRAGNNRINDMIGDTEDESKPGTVGTGAFARVMKPKNLPDGQVIKYGKALFGVEKDGYLNFLKLLSKGDRMASNPYLPRVYKVKIIDDKQYMATVEELTPLNDLSADELKVIGDKAFGDIDQAMVKYGDNIEATNSNETGRYDKTPKAHSLPNKVREAYEKTTPLDDKTTPQGQDPNATPVRSQSQQPTPMPRTKNNPKMKYRFGLSRLLKGVLTNQVPVDAIQDSKLKQALMLMKKVVKDGGGRGDLHMSNMMARRGPYGAQLVLTDPLA